MKLLTLDVETTVKNTVGNNKGSAFCPDNSIVVGGYKYSDEEEVTYFYNEILIIDKSEDLIVVGHNIKFDLHHIRNSDYNTYRYLQSKPIWDTALAEYILTAQVNKFPKLDEVSVKYGGTKKPDVIKLMWDNGVQTEDMDKDVLRNYLEGDVKNTELVALAQIKRAKELGMYKLILSMGRSLIATTEMEYNGIRVDEEQLKKVEAELVEERNDIQYELIQSLCTEYPDLPDHVINFNSNRQLSSLIFGGEIEYAEKIQTGERTYEREAKKIAVGIYQSGLKKGHPRYKLVKEKVTVPEFKEEVKKVRVNWCKLRPKTEWKTNDGYSTSKHILGLIKDEDQTGFIHKLLRLKKLEKQISTYGMSLLDLVYDDGFIHHNLIHFGTDTGRLSSHNPNMQNIPKASESNIKSIFVSRWDNLGYIVNVDYSQIEVVWLAYMSGNKNMIQDIINGVDFHCKRLAQKEHMPYDDVVRLCKGEDADPEWIKKRTKIKSFTFARSYGAGAKKIAKESGMEQEEVVELIANESILYPDANNFHKEVSSKASMSLMRDTHHTKSGKLANTGYYQSLTGRAYAFREVDGFNGRVGFSPTEIKNYPIQGGATGDVVPMMLGELYYELRNSPLYDDALLINTVHDSITLDVKEHALEKVCHGLRKVLTSVQQVGIKELGIDIDIPFQVDIEYGRNWADMKPFNI